MCMCDALRRKTPGLSVQFVRTLRGYMVYNMLYQLLLILHSSLFVELQNLFEVWRIRYFKHLQPAFKTFVLFVIVNQVI